MGKVHAGSIPGVKLLSDQRLDMWACAGPILVRSLRLCRVGARVIPRRDPDVLAHTINLMQRRLSSEMGDGDRHALREGLLSLGIPETHEPSNDAHSRIQSQEYTSSQLAECEMRWAARALEMVAFEPAGAEIDRMMPWSWKPPRAT